MKGEFGLRYPGNFCLCLGIWKICAFGILEIGILVFGIRNSAQGIRNPTNDWNPESRFH